MELNENYKKELEKHKKNRERIKKLVIANESAQKEILDSYRKLKSRIESEFVEMAKFIIEMEFKSFETRLKADEETYLDLWITETSIKIGKSYKEVCIKYDIQRETIEWGLSEKETAEKYPGLISNWTEVMSSLENIIVESIIGQDQKMIKNITAVHNIRKIHLEKLKNMLCEENQTDTRIYPSKTPSYWMMITQRDNEYKPSSYYAENPWEGKYSDSFVGNSAEDFMKENIKGLFYQLFDYETGMRFSYGAADFEKIRKDISEYESTGDLTKKATSSKMKVEEK